MLAAFQLRPAPRGRTYQLWGIETGKARSARHIQHHQQRGAAGALLVPGGWKIAVGAVTRTKVARLSRRRRHFRVGNSRPPSRRGRRRPAPMREGRKAIRSRAR